jgi:hypothetical protein
LNARKIFISINARTSRFDVRQDEIEALPTSLSTTRMRGVMKLKCDELIA